MTRDDIIPGVIGWLAACLMLLAFRHRRRRAAGTAAPPLAAPARLCLLATWATWGVLLLAGAAAVCIAVPQLLLVLLFVAVYFRRRAFRFTGWAYGTARWGEAGDAAAAGMLNGGGLPLGRLPAPSLREAARFLRNGPAAASEAACRLFLAAVRRQRLWVSAPRFTHAAVFAPAGAGKSTGLVIPYLLTCPDAMVVIDVKGELAAATADHRRRAFGHQIVLLDPYRQVTDRPDTFNPMGLIDPRSPFALDDVRDMAAALVVRAGTETEPHWNDAAEMFVGGIAALVQSFDDPAERTLQNVAAILSDPDRLEQAQAMMRASPDWGGLLARMGGQLAHFRDEERGSVLTTANRHLKFLSTPAVAESTARSSFDPRGLVQGGRQTVYLIIPPDRLQSLAGLLRLWITALLRVVVRSGLKLDQRTRFVLDEAAALGRLEPVENAISQLRGYGLNCLFFYQSMGQLEKCYPQGQAQTFLSNMDLQVYFGLRDFQSASYVSDRLGGGTIAIVAENGGASRSRNRDPHGLESVGTTDTTGYGVQELRRKLAEPEEVMMLHERQAVVFAAGAPPLLTRLVRHYEPEFASYLRRESRRDVLIASALLALVTAVVVAVLVGAAARWQPGFPPALPDQRMEMPAIRGRM